MNRRIQESTLQAGTQERKNLQAVASMLEALSPNGCEYVLEDVYLDFGAKWMWTTICRRGGGKMDCQVLSPRQWKAIVASTTLEELTGMVIDVTSDEYFGDK